MLERSDIVWALEQLAVRLGNAGHTVSISVVGGAAIALEHNPDRGSTNDIDGWISATPATRTAVDSVIADISRERGWPDDWLNDKATTNGFIPEDAEAKDFHEVVSHGDVTITVAGPTLLFAMKLRASRGRRDFLDLDVLVGVCEITSRAAAVELYEGHYPEDPLSAKAQTWLDQHFPAGPQPTH